MDETNDDIYMVIIEDPHTEPDIPFVSYDRELAISHVRGVIAARYEESDVEEHLLSMNMLALGWAFYAANEDLDLRFRVIGRELS